MARGTRVAVSMGSMSREAPGAERRERRVAVVEAVAGDVRFMRTRGKPAAAPECDWPELQGGSSASSPLEDERRRSLGSDVLCEVSPEGGEAA